MSTTPDLTDTVKISPNSLMVSRLMDKVNAMPDTRPEVVAGYQDKVKSGNYPPPALVNGFAKLMGGALSLDNKSTAATTEDQNS